MPGRSPAQLVVFEKAFSGGSELANRNIDVLVGVRKLEGREIPGEVAWVSALKPFRERENPGDNAGGVRKISSFTNLCRTLVQVSVYTTSIFLTQVSTHIHFTSLSSILQLNKSFKTRTQDDIKVHPQEHCHIRINQDMSS